ncbi:MAG: F0F1 ATP synthase subunit delta [Tistlia sp.]|uniref:F0F1 ATP synthase subunit delta n=1 Tax=Tistlia sp. TaxID=3057121 RepID=UPI0034A37637
MAGEDSPVGGLAKRYATALIELADQAKKLDAVAEDLRGLSGLIEESADLRRLLRSPLYDRDEQIAAMGEVLSRAGVDDLTRRFVLVVAGNRRLFALPGMIDGYLAELARRRGEVTAKVSAARELDKAQLKTLQQAIDKVVGGTAKIELKVDPALLGGLVVRVGSRMIDGSLKGKLDRLQLAMKGAQ